MIRETIYASQHLAGMVTRFHTWPMLRKQTIAEHCWRVAGIYCEIFGLPRAEVLYFCLHHDSGELWSGDVPFKLKEKMPELGKAMREAEKTGLRMLNIKLPEITDLEKIKVKISDLLEMHETGWIEYSMGNQFAEPVMKDTLAAALTMAGENCLTDQVHEWYGINNICKNLGV
jgi:5'-deoxynucleotidase YfbR-like HD superfamily hydrolase